MAARLIDNIRRGQAELKDRKIAEILVERGVLTATEIPALLESAAPGQLADLLLDQEQVTSKQVQQVETAISMMELMETVSDADAPVEVQQAEADPDRRIGRYVLVSELGAGGMGIVWRAWDGQLNRWVALKLLKVQDPKLIRRFMREATLLAKLAHSNITRVYEVGVHEGKPFLVMEIIEGNSLGAEVLERKEAAQIIRDAARAVHYAHEEKIIHRDIKPSNLLQSDRGNVFVTDFGLARMREEGSSLTASGALLGTPSFMAPEQAQGKDADNRTDVYGLGATLYALVEGKPPYTGELVHELVKRVAISNPPSLVGTDDLVVVTQKAMERDREDRYQTAGELAEELDRYINDEPIEARKITSIERVWRRAKRKPAMAASITLGAVLVLGALSWSGLFLTDYVQRRAAISAASPFVARGEAAMKALSNMYQSQTVNPEWERDALANLETATNEAVKLAPLYGESNFQKGMLHFWREEYDESIQWFDKAIEQEPTHHEARARRVHANAVQMPSPEAIQDYQGFRIVPASLTTEQQTRLQSINNDLSQLPEDYTLRKLGEAVVASVEGSFSSGAESLADFLAENSYEVSVRGLYIWLLLGAGDYQKAVYNADLILQSNPSATDTLFQKAYGHAGQTDLDLAVDAMRRSLEMSEDASSRNWLAFWLAQQKNFDQALAQYNRVLQEDPEYVESLLGRSSVYGLTDPPDFEAAFADAEKVVTLDPDNAYGFFLLGQALTGLSPESAILAHGKAIELDPDYEAHATAIIANNYFSLGEYAKAIEALQSALDLRPQEQLWRWQLANFQSVNGDPNGAEATLMGGELNQDALTLLSRIKRQQGDLSAALAAARDAVELDTGQAMPWVELGALLALAGDTQEAQASFDKGVALSPSSENVLYAVANGWFQADYYEQAALAGESYRKEHPENADAYALLGSISFFQNNAQKTLAMFKKAFELAPDNLYYQRSYAESLLQAGEFQKAQNNLEQVLEGDANDLYARTLLGQSLWGQGDIDTALTTFTAVLEADSEQVWARLYRSQILAAQKQCEAATSDLRQVIQSGVEPTEQLLNSFKSLCPDSALQ